MDNGRKHLDLTELTELAHIKIGTIEFEIPLDVPVKLQVRWNRTITKLRGKEDLTDEESVRFEDDLWEMAEEMFAGAQPPVGRPVREFMTIPAVAQMIAFLMEGYSSAPKSTIASQSPTPTAAPSP